MQNKIKLLVLGAASLLTLSACSEIIAKPTGYKDDKVMNVDDDLYNNLMSIIYDDIHENNVASQTLEKVLYQYAVSIFGPYDQYVKGYKDGDDTLFTVKDGTNVDDFVKGHKAYWTVNDDGKRVDDEGTEVAEDANASQSEKDRVKERFNNIEKRVAKKMYQDISGGSYSDRSIFREEKYLMSLRNNLEKVNSPATVTTYTGLLDPAIEDVDVFNAGILNKGYYWGLYSDGNNTYVEDKIVPQIYKEMLVEQYILDEQYNTLGRSYARKVNIVSIKTNNEYPLAARYLVNQFVNDYILAEPNGNNTVNLDTLKILSNAWKGADLSAEEEALLVASNGFEYDSTNDYYKGTEYGDMMEDYLKIKDDPQLSDTSVESDFTGGGTYTKEVGKELKEREIYLRDHTETGWYIKDGGLTNLPDSLRSRLFNVGVANALTEKADLEAQADRWQGEAGNYTYAKPVNESPYVARINGAYFLKTETTESGSADRDMVFYDKDGSTFYIVQILEAASSSKLSKINENRYSVTRPDDAETFVMEICEVVAEKDTYETLSTKHWLDKAGILYHDQVVYNYFKTNYPELFD